MLSYISYARTQNYSISTVGTLFVVNKLDRSITVFDLETGALIKELFVATQPREITALPDKKSVAFTNYGDNYMPGKSISLLDVNTLQITKKIPLQSATRPHGITSFRSSNRVAVATNGGNKLFIIDTDKDSIELALSTKQRISHMVVAHPYKPLIYVTHKSSGNLSVIDYTNNQIVTNINCGMGADGIDITPDGKEIWIANTLENTISVINTDTNELEDTLLSGKESYRLKFSVDGKYCFVSNAQDGTVLIFDRHTKERIKSLMLPGKKNFIERALYHTPRPVGILMHPNGEYAFVSNSNADKVEVIDMKTFEIVSNINTGRVPDGLALVTF
ncbi:MAG: hypothetical protein CMB99_08095 [Flavobacteriaceae bacterium]|nr:hypothetical protein [Flavobacteriaceae bacterium]|tara:strand:- start:133421 stop:134419 length:999 start_codon:yes stop_codon:yes gene_type:complete